MRYGLHSLRVAGYNAAKQGKHGTALAVAHGGWMSTAHERYDRFNIDDVIDLARVVVSSVDAESGSVALLHRAPAVRVQSDSDTNVRPRPDRIRSGTGAVRGSKRKAAPSQQRTAQVSNHAQRLTAQDSNHPQRLLRVRDRVEVWWTEERAWFAASVKRVGKERVCTLLYDTNETLVHDLDDETWRYL